jgi:O-antigen/teichoic acid export membrane protein
MTAAWAKGDKEEFHVQLATGIAVFLLVPVLLLSLSVVLVLTVPFGAWIGLHATPIETARVVVALLALQTCLAMPQGLVLGVYRATGALPRGVMLANTIVFFQIVLGAAVLLSGHDMAAMAITQSLPIVAVALWAVRDLSRGAVSLSKITFGSANLTTARAALHPSLHFFGIQIAQALSLQGTVLAIGSTLGALEVALFATLRTLANIARQLLALLSHSAWPEFTRLDAEDQHTRITELFVVLVRTTMLLTVILVIGLEAGGQQLFDLWLGGRLHFDSAAMRAFGLYVLLTVAWTLSANVLMSTNRHIALARWYVLAGIAGVIGCQFGAQFGGVEAAVLGIVVGESLPMTLVALSLLVRAIQGTTVQVLIQEFGPVAAVLALWWIAPPMGAAMCGWLGWRAVRAWRHLK